MSSLKQYQKKPNHLINNALNLYRSKKIKTAVVEGLCDKRFLSQWLKKDAPIRFDGLDGKDLVENIFLLSKSKIYLNYDFLYLFADVDYDTVAKKQLIDDPRFIYNAHCSEKKQTYYNDLEIYLINTYALEKVLVNLDLAPQYADTLREKLEKASREIGRFRVADIILQKKENLSKSILNGIDLLSFFDKKSIEVNTEALEMALPNWSNYPIYTDDLVETANTINSNSLSLWSLSRGHDVTLMLLEHLNSLGKRVPSRENLELLLRLACEWNTYSASPMGNKLKKEGGKEWLIDFAS